MPSTRSTYHSRLYRDFKGIAPAAYHDLIRFFEEKETEIRRLDPDEAFEMTVVYTEALYEAEAFRKFLLMADEVIETSMRQSIHRLEGRDVYFQMLYQKAYAYYRLLEYAKAEYILRQLLQIDPDHAGVASLLRRNLYRCKPRYVDHARAGSVLLFFLAALVIGVEVLLVRPFYEAKAGLFEYSRNGIFILGLLFLGGAEGWHRWQVWREVAGFISLIHGKKARK